MVVVCNSEYFEAGHYDIQFPSFIKEFTEKLKEAQSMGYEKYKEKLAKEGKLAPADG